MWKAGLAGSWVEMIFNLGLGPPLQQDCIRKTMGAWWLTCGCEA